MGQVMERVGLTRPPLAGIVRMNAHVCERTKDEPILTGNQCVPYPQHLIQSRDTPRPPIATTHEQKPRHTNTGQNP